MAYLGETFDSSTVEPSKPRGTLPPGWYPAYIKESEIKPTKKAQEDGGDDCLIAITFEVSQGEYQGSKFWENINYRNRNQTAQEIGQGQFSALCRALNKTTVKDTNELHNRELMVKLDVEVQEGRNPRNVVKEYKAYGDGPAAMQASKPAAGASSAPSWLKKA